MSLFQKSVLNKYYNELSIPQIQESFLDFQSIFNNPAKQQNILNAKEEQYQEGFLRELFVNILGYTLYPDENHNLITEQKNETNSKKADGAILNGLTVLAVIELKSTKTVDLNSIESQAFGYKNNQQECKYVITSNFKKLRFYIDNAVEFLEFDLFNLTFDDFKLLWVCLSANYLLKNIPAQIKEASNHQEERITKQLYADYARFRTELFNDICAKNTDYDRLFLFKKTQKLLDRFLFLFFAEDRGLVSPNWTRKILQDWTDLKDKYDNYIPLYTRFRKNFDYLNTGYHGKDGEIFAYNGGLFAPDEVLDSLTVDDDLLYKGSLKLSNYDFDSEVDVNILGHIFEHSLNEIDEIQASLTEEKVEKVTKRKKDGVFYTPKYITKYIVENTIGTLCKAQKEELEIIEEDFEFIEKGKKKKKREELNQKINDYRAWLLDLKIVDPACGSGAFLNQALEFLIAEHTKLDELRARLLGGSIVLSDVETSILENNLYGVDINDEAVEIAKLSLWLRTARKGRKLNSLNNNLKCGNSLIDDVEVAGDKAFNWNVEFKEVFDKGGFDVVIGNPPYGAFLDKDSKDFYLKSMNTFQGNYEIYFFFIELVSKLIKQGGKLGFITPDTWINIPQAQKLRVHVLENYSLNSIITFKHSVFVDASVNAIIFINTYKVFNEKCLVVNYNDIVSDISNSISISKKLDVKNWMESVDNQFQVFQNLEDSKIIEKIERISNKGMDYLDVCQGIVPYSTENLTKEEVKNRIFHSNIKESETFGIWIQGRAVNRYVLNLKNHEFLNYGKWLHRPRKFKYFSGERILIQEITGGKPPRISATFCSGTLFHDPGIISCLNISELETKYLLGIINSKLTSWYNLMTSPKGNRTTFPKILIGDIRKLPVKMPDAEQQLEIVDKVNLIIDLNIEFQKAQNKFIDYYSSQFGLNKVSAKLENWCDLNFTEFIAEINKLIKAVRRNQIGKNDEFAFFEVFGEQKSKVLAIKLQVEQIDKEIDNMVYKLYELTEEEIKIVEG